jgi:hypothetical protein
VVTSDCYPLVGSEMASGGATWDNGKIGPSSRARINLIAAG